MSTWGGSEQLMVAEEAVEAVTLAEAEIEEPSTPDTTDYETDSILTTEPNEEDEELLKEQVTKFRIRFKISEASLIIEQVN
jgi:hypothetical protein